MVTRYADQSDDTSWLISESQGSPIHMFLEDSRVMKDANVMAMDAVDSTESYAHKTGHSSFCLVNEINCKIWQVNGVAAIT